MLGPLAIFVPLLAILSDDDGREVDWDDLFKRAYAFGDYRIVLDAIALQSIKKSLLDITTIEDADALTDVSRLFCDELMSVFLSSHPQDRRIALFSLTGLYWSTVDQMHAFQKVFSLYFKNIAPLSFPWATDLSNTDLAGANFSCFRMNGIDFRSANLEGTNFHGSNLSDVDFRKANLRGARFDYSELFEAKFEGADVTDADFTGAKIRYDETPPEGWERTASGLARR